VKCFQVIKQNVKVTVHITQAVGRHNEYWEENIKFCLTVGAIR